MRSRRSLVRCHQQIAPIKQASDFTCRFFRSSLGVRGKLAQQQMLQLVVYFIPRDPLAAPVEGNAVPSENQGNVLCFPPVLEGDQAVVQAGYPAAAFLFFSSKVLR